MQEPHKGCIITVDNWLNQRFSDEQDVMNVSRKTHDIQLFFLHVDTI